MAVVWKKLIYEGMSPSFSSLTLATNTKFVAPGTNTLSDAVTAMSDGDCLILGAGTYTQSVVVTIPNTVRNFSIIGQGPGATTITFTADTNGIVSQTAYMTVTSSNKYIDFDEGGGELTATLTEGNYSVSDLCAEIVTQMEAAGAGEYSCYSYSGGNFGIANVDEPPSNFSILWKTGTHGSDGAGNSAASLLGFSTAANDTGATSYSADSNTSVDKYRINRATLAGFKMVTSNTGAAVDKYGISLWGDNYDNTNQPHITIRDVDITYEATQNTCWHTAIRLLNSKLFHISDVNIRRQSNARNGHGISIESGMNGTISNCYIMSCGTAIDLIQANVLYIQGVTEHGTEAIDIYGCQSYIVDYGIRLGYKCFTCRIKDWECARPKTAAIFEDVSSGPANGGYHHISGGYIDIDSNFTGDRLIFLARPGSTVHGVLLNAQEADTGTYHNVNGIEVFDDGAGGYIGEACVVSSNVLRGCGGGGSNGIFINAADNCIVANNVFENTQAAGGDIYLGAGCTGCIVIGNIYDDAITDVDAANTLEHNVSRT